ncbi:MAG TPA: EGF domain-containing protein, partial [Polyangium sp.]|nr:EGF domain-containing protein [Polyangium sp.]
TCYACTAAKKGSGQDGVCAFIKVNTDPDEECNPGVCNGSGVCNVPTCTSSTECGSNATCTNSACVCDMGYTGDGYNCTDINECSTNNGGCDVNATCTNTPGSRTCACNMGYMGDGITCTPNPLRQIETGSDFTCARTSDGRVTCWGNNEWGTLGVGDTQNRTIGAGSLSAIDLGKGRTATSIAVGWTHACALLDNGQVKCWGRNKRGELGVGDSRDRGDDAGEMGDALPAVDLGTGKTAVAITAGWSGFTCAILNDASVKCWGAAQYLGLGDNVTRGDNAGEMGDALPVVDLGAGRTAVAIDAGLRHTCALLDDGSVKCWGLNQAGELGLGDTNPRYRPDLAVNLGTRQTATAISVGQSHSCVLLSDGDLKCWGYNGSGQLGLGDRESRGDEAHEMGDDLPAVKLGTGLNAVSISGNNDGTCAILNNGRVKCWGNNEGGILGLADNANRGDNAGEMGDSLPFIRLGQHATAVLISGSDHKCALLSDNGLVCWGSNHLGQAGSGDVVIRAEENLPRVFPF